ncbi:MAG: hypothetical protein J6U68_03260, partial [Clostridia bacterium]|nr:hypothetical protein [Clostridia bacterium]
GENKAQADTLLYMLKRFDSASPYTASTDSVKEDGSPEILIGLTNRAESEAARKALSSYLDFSITVTDNKIVIYANTAERLAAAVKKFYSVLTFTNKLLAYPNKNTYVDSYKSYSYSSLKIADVAINKFSIVISSTASQTEKDTAATLAQWIGLNTGYSIPTVTDSTSATANEIIIGKTNRSECSEYTTDYINKTFHSVTIKNKKLLIFAGTNGSYDTALSIFTDAVKTNSGSVKTLSVVSATSNLSGKKAIFIGNSFIYWGGCVTHIKNDDSLEATRAAGGDLGYFNSICKANGADIDVYNYTYGGKNLDWIYSNKLSSLSPSFLNDIDYVFISEAGENHSSFKTTINKIKSLFKNAEEFVYLAHENTFASNATYIINALPDLAKDGFKIVAWGDLVRDVYKGTISVPGATKQYNKNTFVKKASSSEKMNTNAAVISNSGYGDSFHQNPLSGYITAQMCFSAISGASAVGQKYDFCWDKTIHKQYDLENFLMYQYGSGETSNFIEVFKSSSDMLGLQKLMDEYMNKYN